MKNKKEYLYKRKKMKKYNFILFFILVPLLISLYIFKDSNFFPLIANLSIIDGLFILMISIILRICPYCGYFIYSPVNYKTRCPKCGNEVYFD